MPKLLERKTFTFHPRFIEGSYDEAARTADVIIITEGLGNSRDKNFYTAQAIEDAVNAGVFEGAQSYADHPSKFDESNRPERSVRDLIGYYFGSNLRTVADPKTGAQVKAYAAKFKIQEGCDWAVGLIKEAIDYSSKFKGVYAGISINADGDTEPGNHNGEQVNLVKRITEAFSADVVTKPARGGKFLKLVEGASGAPKEFSNMTVLEAAAKLKQLAEGDKVDPKALLEIAKSLREAKGKPTAKDPDGDGDDDTTVAGDTDKDHAGKGKESKKEAKDDEEESKKESRRREAKDDDEECKEGDEEESEDEEESKKESKDDDDEEESKKESAAIRSGKLIESMTPAKAKQLFPSLWNAALREAEATVSDDVKQLKQENKQLKASAAMRESIDLGRKLLKESNIPVKAHAAVLSDLIGLPEREMKHKVRATEALFEAYGEQRKIEGAGPGYVRATESDVKKNTAALMEGMG